VLQVGFKGTVGEDDALIDGVEVVAEANAGEGKNGWHGSFEGNPIDGYLGDTGDVQGELSGDGDISNFSIGDNTRGDQSSQEQGGNDSGANHCA